MACPLLAALWEPDVAVASALRWFSAGFFAVASIAIWHGGPLSGSFAQSIRARRMRNFLVVIVVLVYVAMGAYVAGKALRIGRDSSSNVADWSGHG